MRPPPYYVMPLLTILALLCLSLDRVMHSETVLCVAHVPTKLPSRLAVPRAFRTVSNAMMVSAGLDPLV